MGGGRFTAVTVCSTLSLRAPRNEVACTHIWLAPFGRLAPLTVTCNPVSPASAASSTALFEQPHRYASGLAAAAETLSTASSHLPIVFGPCTVSEGCAGAAGARTARSASPAASDAPSRVLSPPPRKRKVAPGKIIACLPSNTLRIDASVHTHAGVAPRPDALTSDVHSAAPLPPVGTSNATSIRDPTALKLADTALGALT